MPHFQTDVPEGVEHVLNDALGMRRSLVGADEEQVDVAGRRHYMPTIAAGCENRETLALSGVPGAMHMNRHIVVERMQDFIHDS